MTMDANSIMERVQEAINERAELQAHEDGTRFCQELLTLLKRHDMDGPAAKFCVAPEMVKTYTKARAAHLKDRMEAEAAQRILGEDVRQG